MVVGFIVEGATEKIIIESLQFREFLNAIELNYIEDIIDAKGAGNLLPYELKGHVKQLSRKGAEIIVILTDLQPSASIEDVQNRVNPNGNHVVAVAVQQIEAWLLADIQVMKIFLDDQDFQIAHPESYENPFNEINNLRIQRNQLKVKTKPVLAQKIISEGFDVRRAAAHPGCASARYFINILTEISQR